MGLDTTHGAWSGPYSMFMTFREWLGEQIDVPLPLMEGFYSPEKGDLGCPWSLLEYKYPVGDELDMSSIRRLKRYLPIKWKSLKWNPLFILLSHSDCDGEISYGDCGKIAKELRKLIEGLPNDNAESRSPQTARGCYDGMYNACVRFAEGCERAHKAKERLLFR